MPQLFGVDVSEEVYRMNSHLAKQPKLPKTDARKEVARLMRERLENQFDAIWQHVGGDPDFWLRGHLFDTERGWHLDRYNAQRQVAVEIHGGQYMRKSGHSNAAGQQRDWEKLNRCNELGITLFGLTTAMVNADEVEKILQWVRNGN